MPDIDWSKLKLYTAKMSDESGIQVTLSEGEGQITFEWDYRYPDDIAETQAGLVVSSLRRRYNVPVLDWSIPEPKTLIIRIPVDESAITTFG